MKRMKKKYKCARQFTYMAEEMKKLKGVYLFTKHKNTSFLDAIKMLVIITYFLGVKKHIIRQNFSQHRFVKSIFNKSPTNVKYFTIATKKHHVSTNLQPKIGLSR